MPRVNYDVQATWDAAYAGPPPEYTGTNPPILHYTRERKSSILGNDHWRLRAALNIQPGQSIILVGAGYGWIAEDWAAAGYGPIVALETSPYIQSTKAGQASITLYAEDMSTNASRGRVRQALGLSGNQQATWCISEDVMPVLTDAEAVALAGRMRIVATNVAHWVMIPGAPGSWDPAFDHNWKSPTEWKALLAPDLIVARGSDTVA